MGYFKSKFNADVIQRIEFINLIIALKPKLSRWYLVKKPGLCQIMTEIYMREFVIELFMNREGEKNIVS
jgi:hypothetical protein